MCGTAGGTSEENRGLRLRSEDRASASHREWGRDVSFMGTPEGAEEVTEGRRHRPNSAGRPFGDIVQSPRLHIRGHEGPSREAGLDWDRWHVIKTTN